MATETKADLEQKVKELEAQIEATGVPHVYSAVANILKSLSVQKNGVLPGTMGGKPYISAVDLAAETKRMFVENDLIALPDETVTKHEIINDNGRKSIFIGIEAQYTIISTKDGSMVTVQGVGDGIALGSAVSSNIASTNAMKNAFLRLFMVTEQSVEDQATEPREEKGAPQAVQRARQPQAPKAKAGTPSFKDRILTEIIQNPDDDRTKDDVNKLWDKIMKETGKGREDTAEELYTRLKSGEVAE